MPHPSLGPIGVRPLTRLLSRLCFLALLLPALAGAETLLGVHPYRDPDELQRRFAPLAAYLSERLGETVTVRVGRSYGEHIEAIGRDEMDIAFLGPAPYVAVVRRFGSKPLLARLSVAGEPTLSGDIVVREESPIRRLEDLKGRIVVFGDPYSTMSSLVPRQMLREAGVETADLQLFRHLPSHDDVALAVLAGDADAGAVKHEVLALDAYRGLRSIAETPRISEHLFVTRADLPPMRVEAIRQALLGLDDPRVLTPLNAGTTGLVPVADADYDPLRRILQALGTDGPAP